MFLAGSLSRMTTISYEPKAVLIRITKVSIVQDKGSTMSLLWVPYVVLATLMVFFFLISFALYHMKRRKYQLRRWASKCLREQMRISGKESVATVEATSTPEPTTPSGLERNSSSLSEFVSENTIIPMTETDYNSVVRIHPMSPSESIDSKV